MTQVLDIRSDIIALNELKAGAYEGFPLVFETRDGCRGRLVCNPITQEFAVLSAVFSDSDTFKGLMGSSRISIVEKALAAGIKVYMCDDLQIAARDHNAWIFMAWDTRLSVMSPCTCDVCSKKKEVAT